MLLKSDIKMHKLCEASSSVPAPPAATMSKRRGEGREERVMLVFFFLFGFGGRLVVFG